MKKLNILLIVSLISYLISLNPVSADWPMAGHDNQRTSNATEETGPTTYNQGCGRHIFADYIPLKSHLITVDRGTTNSLIYVTTSVGIYALKSANLTNTASDIVWFYPTSMPPGHSPTVDKATNIMYIPILDGTIHAINALTGAPTGVPIWKTLKAGGGFYTSPLVANNKVYAGNRDGYMYAFDKSNGQLAWSYQTGGPVDYSAAISADNNTLYFASHDSRAYAVNATTGTLIARSEPFPGWGFAAYWPVVNTQANRVIFTRSNNFPNQQTIQQTVWHPDSYFLPDGIVPEVAPYVNWLTANPEMRTLYPLDPQTLVEREVSPYMWWGDNGNRYPPVIGNDGTIWAMSPWRKTENYWYAQGRIMGWQVGSAFFTPEPHKFNGNESEDEPQAISKIGNSIWYAHGGDGADGGGVASLTSDAHKGWWGASALLGLVGEYWTNWPNFRYGNGMNFNTENVPGMTGSHGYQNPPVPLRNRVYLHRSNAVVCLQP